MRHSRERGHMRAKSRLLNVLHHLEQPALMIDQQHDRVVRVDHGFDGFAHTLLEPLIRLSSEICMLSHSFLLCSLVCRPVHLFAKISNGRIVPRSSPTALAAWTSNGAHGRLPAGSSRSGCVTTA